MRVAIIGGGPSGILTLAAFQEAKSKGEQIPEIVLFERQSEIGGLWNLTWRTGVDVDGFPVHNGMYRHLWSNGPKEALEFPDYSFEQHYGEKTCSYPPRLGLRDYLMGYVNKHHKIDHSMIRCNTYVKNVEYSDDKFTITAKDSEKEYSEQFDRVVVASGHFSTPNMPTNFENLDQFKGLITHSHDFRNAEAYEGQTIVVVGKSYSAEDVASQLYKYKAKKVIITHRKKND